MAFFSWTKRVFAHSSRNEPETVRPEFRNTHANRRLLSYQIANMQGIGTCRQQEDSFGFVNATDVTQIRKKGFMAIVADGMGGMADGKFASETAVTVLRSVFDTLDYKANLTDQLNEGMHNASDRVFEALNGMGGSTAIACLIYKGELYFSSVGDSYLLLKRDNQLFRLNRPHNILHSNYYEEIKKGSTDTTEAECDDQKAAVTQYLGKEFISDIDCFYRPLPLHDGDVIMICSDGVAGVLSEECLLSCLNCITPDEMCSELEKNIIELKRSYQDNFTALVIKCEY